MTIEKTLLNRAARMLDARIGLKRDIAFRPRLARILKDVGEEMKLDSRTLVDSISSDSAVFDALLNRITVQESGFFRHSEQFDLLAGTLLPDLRVPPKAWSAACANGQEAYSFAMTFRELGGGGSVIASDVTPAALRRTMAGAYHEREMAGVSRDRRRRHFVAVGSGWQAHPSLRSMITVQRHNLLDPIPPQVGSCHVVMCRNVLIYLEQRHAEIFLGRLADAMNRDAYLFVGGAETLWQLTDRFEAVQMGVAYVYRPHPRGARGRSFAQLSRLKAPSRNPVVAPAAGGAAAITSTRAPGADVEVRSGVQPDETGRHHAQLGRELLARGSGPEAIVAFRQWAYLAPDDPTAHFQLGSALAAAGAPVSALRAFRAALGALDRCDADGLVDVLHGYDRSELRRLLTDLCAATGASS